MTPEIVVLDDAATVAEEAAARWGAAAEEAVAARGRFAVALSGGSTPRTLYQRLAEPPYRDSALWAETHVFWGDERTVPPSHPDSNYRMAHETLLSRVAVLLSNIHRPRAEKQPADAASDYEQVLRLDFRLRQGEFPRFDLILLGMGADGHTASLFPGNPALSEMARLFVATHVPQQKTTRLTITVPVLNAAASVLFLVVGEEKAETLHSVLEGDYRPSVLPAQFVRPENGRVTWLVDRAAARALSSPQRTEPLETDGERD